MGKIVVNPSLEGIPQVATISAGAVGSGRLVDLPVPAPGRTTIYYVANVRDFFRWNAADATAADGKTIVALIANGANPGRFERMGIAALEWMLQQTWFIDEANSTGLASDENDGSTVATPLASELERQRRMGPYPGWSAAEYHLRYVSDWTNPIELTGRFTNPACNIYVHGSATNGQGKATLGAGPFTVNAITAINRAGNQPLLFTANGIAVSWTADGLLNNRCRMTSGAGNGGYVWPTLDLGGKQAQMSETMVPAASSYTNPFTFPTTEFAPALNDTFVVESLSTGAVNINLTGASGTTANTVIFDSVQFSGYSHTGAVAISTIGCIHKASTAEPGNVKTLQITGGRIGGTSVLSATAIFLNACYFDDSQSFKCVVRCCNNGASTFARVITVQRQGFRICNPTPSGGGGIIANMNGGLGIFNNSAGAGLEIEGNVTFNSTQTVWGTCGAGGTPILLQGPGSRLCHTAALPGAASYYAVNVAAAPGACWISYRGAAGAIQTTAPVFDPATSIFTGYIALTPANLQATIAAGGFNGQFFDPQTQCSMAGT